MPQQGAIDLTSGFVPKSQTLDLSAGLVPKTAPAMRPDQIPGLTPANKQAQAQLPKPTTTTEDANASITKTMSSPGGMGAGEGWQGPAPTEILGHLSNHLNERANEHELGFLKRAASGGPPASYWEKAGVKRLRAAGYLSKIGSAATSLPGEGMALAAPFAPLPVMATGLTMAAKDLMTPQQPGESQADALQRHLTAWSGVAGSLAMAPEAAAQFKGVPETAAATLRRGFGANPTEIANAEGKAGEAAAGVAERNAAAGAAGEQKNAQAEADAQAAHNEATRQWEAETAQGMRDVADQRATQLAEHAGKTQTIREANAKLQEQVAQRTKLVEQTRTQAEDIGNSLQEFAQAAEQEARAMYPKVKGQIEDPAGIAQSVESAAKAAMRESGPIPPEIQRIVDGYTPQETGGEDLGDGHVEGYPLSEKMASQLKNVYGELGEAGAGDTRAEPTFDNLHSQYSALGKRGFEAERAGDGYRAAAFFKARDVIGSYMRQLAKADGALDKFTAAQKNWQKLENTFFNTRSAAHGGSPIAEALGTADPITGKLRPDYVLRVLQNPSKSRLVTEMLNRYGQAEGVQSVANLQKTLENIKALPKKVKLTPEPTPPVVPDYVPKPAPVLERPVPANVPTLEAPPEPFSRKAFIKGKVQQAATNAQKFSPWDLTGVAGVIRHGGGRILENPKVQDWIATEPPQPGNVGAKGAATPFQQPPPPPPGGGSAHPSGFQPPPPTPTGAAPTAGQGIPVVHEGRPGFVTGATLDKEGGLWHLVNREGEEPVLAKHEDIVWPKKTSTGSKAPGYQRAGEAPPTMRNRILNAVKKLKDTATGSQQDVMAEMNALQNGKHSDYLLGKLGVKHQPLDAEMRSELETIFEEKPDISKPEARQIQTVMDSWSKGTFDATEAANRIRRALRLKE